MTDEQAKAEGYRFKVYDPELPIETTSFAPDEETRDQVVACLRAMDRTELQVVEL